MKYVKPVDPASTWHLLQTTRNKLPITSVVSLQKSPELWKLLVSYPRESRNPMFIQKCILEELQVLQDPEIPDPTKDAESRTNFLDNFD